MISAQEEHKHTLCCVCSPYNFRALHKDYDITIFNIKIILLSFFKRDIFSNKALICMGSFKF